MTTLYTSLDPVNQSRYKTEFTNGNIEYVRALVDGYPHLLDEICIEYYSNVFETIPSDIDYFISMGVTDDVKNTLMKQACEYRDFDLFDALIRHSVPVNHKLILDALWGHESDDCTCYGLARDMIECLIDAGVERVLELSENHYNDIKSWYVSNYGFGEYDENKEYLRKFVESCTHRKITID